MSYGYRHMGHRMAPCVDMGMATWGTEEDPGQVSCGMTGFSCLNVEIQCPSGAVGMLLWTVPTIAFKACRSLLGHRSFLATL